MGAFRFSDVDRNIIVASTDFKGATKTPILQKTEGLKKRAHYSDSGDGVDVYGSAYVYVDNMVSNEEVTLMLRNVS